MSKIPPTRLSGSRRARRSAAVAAAGVAVAGSWLALAPSPVSPIAQVGPLNLSIADAQRATVTPVSLRRQLSVSDRAARRAVRRAAKASTQPKERFRKRQVAVEFEAGTSEATRAALRARYGVTRHDAIAGGVERWYLPKSGTEQQTSKALEAEKAVAVASPNHVFTLADAPNDPRYAEQWDLEQANDHDMDASAAWSASDAVATTPVTVAVLDTGVELSHPDLANQLWRNRGEYGPDGRGGRKESNNFDDDFNGYVDDVNGYDAVEPGTPPIDTYYHGTHVAGTIAAERNNNLGIAGMSKQARIMAVRGFEGHSTDEVTIRAGMQYAVDNGASIVSGSFAGGGQSILRPMIEAHPEILFVFAAGNEGTPLGVDAGENFPCGVPLPNVICVGATDQNDKRADFSNYGPEQVDISAPGVDILSTVLGGGYSQVSGTSMATPHVSGAAAVLRSLDPSLTPVDVKARLMRTADPIADAVASGSGRLNLAQAVSNTTPVPAPAPTATVTVTNNLLNYQAAAGGTSAVVLTRTGSTYEVSDPQTKLTPGGGCTAVSATRVRCAGVSFGLFNLGDLADSFYTQVPIPLVISGGTGVSTIWTGNGPDSITTSTDADVIRTGGGNDIVSSSGGNDAVYSGPGNDRLTGGDGNDNLQGDEGDDTFDGGSGNDFIVPANGDDTIEAGDGDDLLVGPSSGADRFYGQNGDDYLYAGANGDTVRDYVDGGSGNDTFIGDDATHTFVGGSGIDTLEYDDTTATPVTAQIGTATGNGYRHVDAIGADIEVLAGGKGDDTLIGSDLADVLRGGPGNDHLDGRGGNDAFDEDLDSDQGGDLGSDDFTGGAGVDIVDYSRPGLASVDWDGAITASLDGVRNDGASSRNEHDLIAADVEGIYGGRKADTLTAGAATSILDGGPGTDTLTGGASGDTIYANDGAAGDTVTCGGGTDLVRRETTDTLAADCESPSETPSVRITGDVLNNGVTNQNPKFTWKATGGPDVTFQCRLVLSGGVVGNLYPCTSGWRSPDATPDGTHTFIVLAKLPTTTSSSALRTFTLDTVAPDTSVTAGPTGTIASETAAFTLASSQTDSTFECRLDNARWDACTSPVTYNGLADGAHNVQFRARDNADNVDQTPVSQDFTVLVPGPQTTLTKAPTSPTAATTASFEFSSDPAGATFECKLDGATWAACTSPRSISGLTTGAHTFSVRGSLAGETDPTPAVHSWTVDPAIAPNTAVDVKNGWVKTPQPVFTLTSDQAGSTFECAIGISGAWAPCASPWTSPAQAQGSSFVIYRFRAKSPAGVYDASEAIIALRFDFTAPDMTITEGPSEGSNLADDQVDFSFATADNIGTGSVLAECKFDAGAWAPCTSPTSVKSLALGQHTFQVRGTDAAGNVDATPATRTFTAVTPVAPQTEWVSILPSATRIGDPSPTLRFKATPDHGARFECAAGPNTGAPFVPCKSPWTVPQQPEGWAVFQVRAIGPNGLVDTSPSTVAYVIDTITPDTTITSGPAAGSTITVDNASFGFSSPEGGATFECKLDAGTWAACTTPKALTGLANGSHTFSVRGRDAAGNIDASPATRTFTVALPKLLTVSAPATIASPVSLTTDPVSGAAVDWIHWKGTTAAEFDRKNATQQISTWTKLLDKPVNLFAGASIYSWTDAIGATPGAQSALGVGTGQANGRGFKFTIPASNAVTRTLKLYVGVKGAATTAALKTYFGDNVAVTQSLASTSDSSSVNRVFTISYRPSGATDTLGVEWYQGGGGTNTNSQAILYAAAIY